MQVSLSILVAPGLALAEHGYGRLIKTLMNCVDRFGVAKINVSGETPRPALDQGRLACRNSFSFSFRCRRQSSARLSKRVPGGGACRGRKQLVDQ